MFIFKGEEGTALNIAVTSREAILTQCRRLVMNDGPAAINMRSVAAACGIALGSLYNYFPSKTALLTATVESVWNDIFSASEQAPDFKRFPDAVQWLYDSLQRSSVTYPGFFTLHAFSFAAQSKESGRQVMTAYFDRIKQRLLDVLSRDAHVRPDSFDDAFTMTGLVDLLFSTVVSLVLRKEEGILPLLEMVRRTLY